MLLVTIQDLYQHFELLDSRYLVAMNMITVEWLALRIYKALGFDLGQEIDCLGAFLSFLSPSRSFPIHYLLIESLFRIL